MVRVSGCLSFRPIFVCKPVGAAIPGLGGAFGGGLGVGVIEGDEVLQQAVQVVGQAVLAGELGLQFVADAGIKGDAAHALAAL